jgi:hypothetical protein
MIAISMTTDQGFHSMRGETMRDLIITVEEVMRRERITKVTAKITAPASKLTDIDVAKADAYLRQVANEIIFDRHFVDGLLDIYLIARYPRRTA